MIQEIGSRRSITRPSGPFPMPSMRTRTSCPRRGPVRWPPGTLRPKIQTLRTIRMDMMPKTVFGVLIDRGRTSKTIWLGRRSGWRAGVMAPSCQVSLDVGRSGADGLVGKYHGSTGANKSRLVQSEQPDDGKACRNVDRDISLPARCSRDSGEGDGSATRFGNSARPRRPSYNRRMAAPAVHGYRQTALSWDAISNRRFGSYVWF